MRRSRGKPDNVARGMAGAAHAQLSHIAKLATKVELSLWEPPSQPNTWANSTMNSASFLAAFYDGLVGNYAGYTVTKASIGKDQSNTYDIYAYTFEPENYERTVILQSGVHGTELPSMFGLSRLINQMMTNPDIHSGLVYLKTKVKLVVIPVSNPWGFSQSTRTYGNSNGVNIVRNFDSNGKWSSYVESSPYNLKGSAPYSESETVALKSLYDSMKNDVDFVLDCHVGIGVGAYDQFIYYISSDDVLVPRLLTAMSIVDDVIRERLSREPVNLLRVDHPDIIKSYYLWDQLGVHNAVIEMVPQQYGGDFNGALDIEYFMLFVSNFLFQALNTDILSPMIQDRKSRIAINDVKKTLIQNDIFPVVLSDTFDRSDSATLGNADTGQSWASPNGTKFGISSRKSKCTESNATAVVLAETLKTNIVVSCEIEWRIYAGIIVRGTDANNFIMARINSTSLAISKVIDGTATALASYSFTPVAGTIYSLKIKAIGTSIKAYLDNKEVLSVIESALLGNTKIGLRTANDTDSTFNNLLVTAIN